MKRFVTFSAGLLSAVAISSLVLAAGHGGGGGGHGGGGGGHMGGGGGGMHMGGGGGGGFHGGSVHMGGFSAGPAFHSGSMGASGFRAPSNLGMRVAPSVSNFRGPSVNLGSSMNRSITSGVPRSAITNIHPNLGGSPGIKIQSGANLAGRTGGNVGSPGTELEFAL